MTTSDSEALWRRLGPALERAGQPGRVRHDERGLAGAHPVFYAAEQAGARWALLGECALTPQEARDELAHQFLKRASDPAQSSRHQGEYRAAAHVLDGERHDEMDAAGRHFQVVRGEQYLFLGADGPEGPGPDDEPGPGGEEAAGRRLIVDADDDVAAGTAALRAAFSGYVSAAGSRPPDVVADERRGRIAYPQVVLLGTWYAIGEQGEGSWRQAWVSEHATVGQARDSLLSYLRSYAPAWEDHSPQECAAYAEAADALERRRGCEITAAARRFRITTIYRAVRMNRGRPEPPRPSDFDPYPPPAA